jgi:glycosyltransferase involved in cell wall biosynthesis
MEVKLQSIKSLSVIIPVYNSAATLAVLLKRLTEVLEKLNLPYEMILVNDGSRDGSWEQLKQLSEQYKELHAINLMRNYGQHNALLCGIRAAQSEVVVTMDDDLQHPPEEIIKLLEKLDEGYDVVYGTPAEQQHGFWRDRASQITKIALQGAMGAETARNVSAFRALRTQLREAFANYQSPFLSLDVLLTWATTRFTKVNVRHDPRRVGASNYNFRKLVKHALNMMTGFSTWPLRLASLLGFLFTLFGIFILVLVLATYVIVGGSVPGFPFLASIIAVFSGVQLFTLGIIGEYLARIHLRMMERPTYSVRETIAPSQYQHVEALIGEKYEANGRAPALK